MKNECVGEVICRAEFIEIKGKRAFIETKITVPQRLVTYDKSGNPLDNTDESVLKITEYWTFSKDLADHDPTWRLTKTHTASSLRG